MQRWILVLLLVIVTAAIISIGLTSSTSIKALSRNPAAAPKIQTAMVLAFIFIAAIVILALLILFHVYTST